MQLAVNHQHWSRLGSEVRPDPAPEKSLRLQNAGLAARKIEDAVRLQVKIAEAVGGVGRLHLPAVLHIKADGLQIGIVHPGIHADEQRFAVLLAVGGKRIERAQRDAALVAPIKRECLLREVYRADRVACAFMGERRAERCGN